MDGCQIGPLAWAVANRATGLGSAQQNIPVALAVPGYARDGLSVRPLVVLTGCIVPLFFLEVASWCGCFCLGFDSSSAGLHSSSTGFNVNKLHGHQAQYRSTLRSACCD